MECEANFYLEKILKINRWFNCKIYENFFNKKINKNFFRHMNISSKFIFLVIKNLSVSGTIFN